MWNDVCMQLLRSIYYQCEKVIFLVKAVENIHHSLTHSLTQAFIK